MTLKEYLTLHRMTAYGFSKKSGIAMKTVYNHLNGGISQLATADMIDKFTDGQVKLEVYKPVGR